jgi:hypothetical protein
MYPSTVPPPYRALGAAHENQELAEASGVSLPLYDRNRL